MPHIGQERTAGNWLEQPAADEEKARQAKQEEDAIEPHRRIAQTEVADMGKDHENHGESPHRIDVFYSLSSHIHCKSNKKSWNSWLFEQKILLLHYERAYQLD